ncbi:putative peptidase M48 [Helianthus annuus]|nr:putative peptidase M48 [Helianthus annuus]
MAWYRRFKLGFDMINCRSKVAFPKPVVSITNYHFNQSSKFTFTSHFQPVSVTKVTSQLRSSRVGCFGYRCYHVDSRPVRKSKLPNISRLFVLVGLAGIWVIGNAKTIWFIVSANAERVIGECQFQMIQAEFEGKVLPVMHPDRVRVVNILNKVIKVLTVLKYASNIEERKGLKLCVSYLERFKWDVLVVEDDAAFACCLPGGKIVVFSGLLEQFTTDDEIASVICHEVAHVVARHVPKRLTKNSWHAFVRQIFYMVDKARSGPKSGFLYARPSFLAKVCYDKFMRMEIEADKVGLLLMACAEYNPRVAPKVFEKMGQVSAFHDYLSVHPWGKARRIMLSEASEAISATTEGSIAGREVDT